MLELLLLCAALAVPSDSTSSADPGQEPSQTAKPAEPAKAEEPEEREEDDQEKKAEAEQDPETEPLTYQETVVVTAAGREQKLGDAGAFVTVFSSEDLARSPALVIDEQLRRVPGFSLFRRSSSIFSHPTTQGVSLRGIGPSGASRSLVLWGGIPLNDPFGNWIYWNRLPMTSQRSVEIASGATSQLYGSSALGGTIQLLPRLAEPKTLDARIQFGNRGTKDADVFASHRWDDWSFVASSRVFDTDGYIPIRAEERGLVDVPTKTEFRTFLGRVAYKRYHFGVNFFGEERSNGTPEQRNDSQIYLFQGGYDADDWRVNLYAQSQELESSFSRILPGRNREIPFGATRFPSVGVGGSFTKQMPNGVQWGADWRRVSWNPDDDDPDNGRSQNLVGAFVQQIFSLEERLDLLVGGRLDFWQNESTQASFNPRAALTFRHSERFTMRSSLYRGFRAPSLNELYRPFRVGNVVTEANPALGEEHLWGFEGGVDYHPDRALLVRVNAFVNWLRNPVANVTLCTRPSPDNPLCVDLAPGTIQRQRQNLGSASIAGVELQGSYRLDERWSFRLGYLLSRANNNDIDRRLPQVARQQGNLGVAYDGWLQFNADVRAVGDAFEDDLNEFVLPSYAVVDFSARYPLRDRLTVYLGVENLFNEDYVVRIEPLSVLGTPRMVHGGVEIRVFD